MSENDFPESGDAVSFGGTKTLEDLGVSAPIEIEPRWLVPPEPGGAVTVPETIADAARAAGCFVINSDEDLRRYIDARGYVLLPKSRCGEIQIDEDGPYLGEKPTPKPGTNPKDALGVKKPNLALVPPASSLYQAQAMMDGARKYGPYNWRSNPVIMMIYISAALRHINALLDGEDIDPISGCYHVGHALACLGIIADAQETGNLIDDRPVPGKAGDLIRRFDATGSYATSET